MDYINIDTFDIKRGRNIPDKTRWIPYKFLDENNQVKYLELPNCEKKYFKYVNGQIKEMTNNQKSNKDKELSDKAFNSRNSQEILRDVFQAYPDNLEMIDDLLSKHIGFKVCLEARNYTAAKQILTIAKNRGEITSEDKTKIEELLPNV